MITLPASTPPRLGSPIVVTYKTRGIKHDGKEIPAYGLSESHLVSVAPTITITGVLRGKYAGDEAGHLLLRIVDDRLIAILWASVLHLQSAVLGG